MANTVSSVAQKGFAFVTSNLSMCVFFHRGMAEFLERSMTAKTRERQPSPLAPNGKQDIE